jgi:hypothetical protein
LPFSPAFATQFVLWGGLSTPIDLGAMAQATRLCTMGALADCFSFGGTSRPMMWALAVALGAGGTQLLIEAQ